MLTKAEKNYSTIEKECLAIVFGTKQFRHYLLGRPFRIVTDHNPLKWLNAQKMEGRLCRWALQLQEFDYVIEYRKGCQNINADAVSRAPHIKSIANVTSKFSNDLDLDLIRNAQDQDEILNRIKNLLREGSEKCNVHDIPKRVCQIWNQLKLKNGLLHRNYKVNGFD